MITSVGSTPVPSIWRLQRTQRPEVGDPLAVLRAAGSAAACRGTARPWTWIRFWSLGQVTW